MTPAPAVRAQPGEAGVILIAVLLAVALMSVMVVAVASLTRAGIGSERLEERRLATDLALRSALERGKALVLATPAERRAFFDGSAEEVELGQGLRARIAVQDVAGFVDLNGSDPALITAVAAAAGLGKAEAEALASRIDALRQQAAARPAPAAAKAALRSGRRRADMLKPLPPVP
jgi:hypothetical protein